MKKIRKQKIEQNEKKFFEYQGAELKNVYKKYILRGLIFSLALHVIIIGGWLISSMSNDANAEKEVEQKTRIIELTDIPPITQTEEQVQPEVKQETKIIPKKDLEAITPVPVKKDLSEINTTKTQTELEEIKGTVSKDGDENGITDIGDVNIKLKDKDITEEIKKDDVIEKKKPDTYETFQVERAPSPVNLGSVQGSMNYPQSAIDNGTEGRVTVKVLVDNNGNVIKIGSISGPSVFKDEVRDKVMNLKFTPAMQNGSTVKCWVSVPFNFKLKSGFGS